MTFTTNKLVVSGSAATREPIAVTPARGRPVPIQSATSAGGQETLPFVINSMREPRNAVVRSVEIKGDSEYLRTMLTGDAER